MVLLQLSEMVAGQGGHRLTPQLVESVAAGATMENLKFFATAMNFFVAEGLLGGELVKILMKSLAGCPGCTFETPLGERCGGGVEGSGVCLQQAAPMADTERPCFQNCCRRREPAIKD